MADKSIRATSAIVDAMSKDWPMVTALMGGTAAMREGGKTWLPQFPQESDDSFKCRLGQAVLHPVFKRTVIVNSARPFAKAVQVDPAATPAKVLEWCADIDLQGSNLAAFLLPLMVDCLSKGLIGVLVDFPKDVDTRTQAEEKATGARPYGVVYPGASILGWKTAKSPNGLQIAQLRLLESLDMPDGEYGLKTIEQVRVLAPGIWQTYRQNEKDPDTWDLFEAGITSLKFVPFVFFYGMRKAFGVGQSPLTDLAFQNVEHWQSASDQQTILHVARVPILFARAFGTEGTLTIGAGSCAQSDNEKAELKYVEHTGAAIEAGRNSLIDLQDRMRATGAELISLDPKYTTATQVSADGEASKSLLQQIVENFEESAEEMLNYMAAWVGEEETASVVLHKDFSIAANTDTAALVSATNAGAISKQTLFDELQRRDVISPEVDWEEEQTKIQGDKDADLAHQVKTTKATAAVTPVPA